MRCGHEVVSGTYYEVLGTPGNWPPVLMIHGGGATGACFREDLNGGPGWADQLAERGHEVWVTDWAGCGRSGNRQVIDIDYADVVSGYRQLLSDVIGRPAVVVPHSMGGPIAWQLIEHEPELVAGVVTIAASSPGNIPPPSTVLADDGDVIKVRFQSSGAEFTIDRRRGYLYEDDYIYKQGIHTSSRFPMDRVGQMRAGLVACPPRMILQRLGVLAGMPSVTDHAGFSGKRIRLIAGTEDPAHSYEIETSTTELLCSWGANAEQVWLGERGITGNGHFMFFEDNSKRILDIVDEQIIAVS